MTRGPCCIKSRLAFCNPWPVAVEILPKRQSVSNAYAVSERNRVTYHVYRIYLQSVRNPTFVIVNRRTVPARNGVRFTVTKAPCVSQDRCFIIPTDRYIEFPAWSRRESDTCQQFRKGV